MNDIEIINLFFERSELAITETSKKYHNLCMQIAENILGSQEDAEECVNDALMCLWNNIPPERPKNLSAYICKMVRNLALKKIEYNTVQKRNPEVLISFSELEEILGDEHPMHTYHHEEIGQLLSSFLRTLKKEQRVVFVRKYWFYDTIADISKRYSMSESKVKSMLSYTRKKLKKYLEKEGYKL